MIDKTYKTSEVAKLIGIHSNTVRMYENLGLISKPSRKDNGYRVFTDLHIYQHSLSAILRMLNKLSEHNEADINEVLNSPSENEDIISVCDKSIISLNIAIQNDEEILEMLYEIKRKYSNPPL